MRTLNGADHDLYDYLAEEVVGDLEDELQRFLMETSILQVVTPELAEVVSGRDTADVARLTAAAERLTLLSRHLRRRRGPISATTRSFASSSRRGCGHWMGRMRSLPCTDGPRSPPRIRTGRRPPITTARPETPRRCSAWSPARSRRSWATGSTPSPRASSARSPPTARPPGFDLILSRVDMQQGDYEAAIAASQAVLDSESDDPVQRDHALLNLMTLATNYGDGEEAIGFAAETARRGPRTRTYAPSPTHRCSSYHRVSRGS